MLGAVFKVQCVRCSVQHLGVLTNFTLLARPSAMSWMALARVYIRPVFKNALCGFRSAHSVSEFLRLIVITGKNFRSIGQL